jgi:hypothetical protein
MAYLYINSRGIPWRKHSYSAGNTFENNAYKYYLQKVLGWRERDNKARFQFGRSLEESIEYYHNHNGKDAVADFVRRWTEYKDVGLEYTKAEKNWENLLRAGTDMMRLYEIRQPYLPIPLGSRVSFQKQFSKEVFPGDENYGGIEDVSKIDILAFVDPHHPMLPKLDWKPEYGDLRPLIIDIKTSALDFPETQGMAAYDAQLRRYSWNAGYRDVALLWFKKTGHNQQKGSSITMLVDAGPFKAGQEAVIALVEDDGVWVVHNDFMIEEMERAQGKKEDGKTDQTKAAKEKRLEWLRLYSVKVDAKSITRQRLQFNAGYVTKKSADDAGLQAGRQIVNIVNAWKRQEWPDTSGIRYPHDDRNDPYFRAFIMQGKDAEVYRDLNFIKSDADELDDLFDGGEEVE